MSESSLETLLCSRSQSVCMAVRPGCSLTLLSPAAKQCKLGVDTRHISCDELGSSAGNKGFRKCKSVYFSLPESEVLFSRA